MKLSLQVNQAICVTMPSYQNDVALNFKMSRKTAINFDHVNSTKSSVAVYI